ncbi:MAG: MazG nucleotide pyrophosphohydrolase domain-containing protein [Labedaea sp.]
MSRTVVGPMAEFMGIAGELPAHAAAIAQCLRRNGFDPEQTVNRQVLGLAEETGEFVGAYRRWSGQARRTGTAEEMYEELADVIITAFVTAHELGVDIDMVIAAKLRTIHTRGWRENPSGGATR